MKVVVAIPHSGSWFLTQICLQSLRNCPPMLNGVKAKIVVIDNSWDTSPSIRGVTDTMLDKDVWVYQNPRKTRTHGGALDLVVELENPDLLVTLETDVTATNPGWLEAFVMRMRSTDFVVGGWHEVEKFANPSCAVYRGSVLQEMAAWSAKNDSTLLRWGLNFEKANAMPEQEWLDRTSPFGERRGWPFGAQLKVPPRMQEGGPGWYEPGQQLFHWAIDAGYTYSVMPSATEYGGFDGRIPIGTFYGPREAAWAVHWWAGSRGLTTMFAPPESPDWTDPCIVNNRDYWFRREAIQWLQSVPVPVQRETIKLIRRHGWRLGEVSERNQQAIEHAEDVYRSAGIDL